MDGTGVLDSVRRWLGRPHDFDWIFEHHSTKPLHRVIRGVFVGAVAVYALVLLLMLGSPNGPQGTVAVGYSIAILVVQVLVIGWLLVGPVPTHKWQFTGFLVFGDLGLASAIVLDTPTSAMLGTFLFSINASICVFFLSPRWLLAHLLFTNAVIVYLGVAAYTQGLWGVNDAVAAVVTASAANSAVPMFAQFAWSLVSHDARQSELDPLTGTPNRRGLQNALEDLWAGAIAADHPVAVVMVDIDRFKSVNDRYGHDEGDAVIIRVARRLQEHLRDHGVVARTGGEEFLAVMVAPPKDVEPAIHTALAALHDRTDPVPITASTGIAIVSPGTALWSSGVSAMTSVTRAADSMMYRAKDSGGDGSCTVYL